MDYSAFDKYVKLNYNQPFMYSVGLATMEKV